MTDLRAAYSAVHKAWKASQQAEEAAADDILDDFDKISAAELPEIDAMLDASRQYGRRLGVSAGTDDEGLGHFFVNGKYSLMDEVRTNAGSQAARQLTQCVFVPPGFPHDSADKHESAAAVSDATVLHARDRRNDTRRLNLFLRSAEHLFQSQSVHLSERRQEPASLRQSPRDRRSDWSRLQSRKRWCVQACVCSSKTIQRIAYFRTARKSQVLGMAFRRRRLRSWKGAACGSRDIHSAFVVYPSRIALLTVLMIQAQDATTRFCVVPNPREAAVEKDLPKYAYATSSTQSAEKGQAAARMAGFGAGASGLLINGRVCGVRTIAHALF